MPPAAPEPIMTTSYIFLLVCVNIENPLSLVER
jgi:hypothetical protein